MFPSREQPSGVGFHETFCHTEIFTDGTVHAPRSELQALTGESRTMPDPVLNGSYREVEVPRFGRFKPFKDLIVIALLISTFVFVELTCAQPAPVVFSVSSFVTSKLVPLSVGQR